MYKSVVYYFGIMAVGPFINVKSSTIGRSRAELRWKRDDGSWIFGAGPRGQRGAEIALNLLGNLKLGKLALSVGCATGTDLRWLEKRGFNAVGLDPERKFLLEGKTKGNADNFVEAIGESMPLRANFFDLVLLLEVLEHTVSPELVLREIARVLKPNGTLLLSVPNRFYPFETHGIQCCNKQIGNLLGVGIPFFSFAPSFLRKKFERARIYSETEILSLLRRHRLEPFVMEYAMPSLDKLQQTFFTEATRKVLQSMSRIPILRKLGISILVVSKRK